MYISNVHPVVKAPRPESNYFPSYDGCQMNEFVTPYGTCDTCGYGWKPSPSKIGCISLY